MDSRAGMPDLITFADEVPTTLPAIEAISERLGDGAPAELARRAIDVHQYGAALRILLAGLLRGSKPPVDLACALAPYIEDVAVAMWLVAASEGDHVAEILTLCASERLSYEREASMLFVAAECLDGKLSPRLLRIRLRRLARRRLEPATSCLVGIVAEMLADEDVLTVAGLHGALSETATGARLASRMRAHLQAPLESVIPARPPEEIESGYTILREASKVGRNDPCPCGSGKKYKRCCGAANASPASPVAPRKRVSPYRSTMTVEQFQCLRSMDLVRLDPKDVATEHLVFLMRGLTTFGFFDEADRALDEMARRAGEGRDLDVDGLRYDIFYEALEAQRTDCAQRLMARLPSEMVEEVDRWALDLARGERGLLGRLEDLIEGGIREEMGTTLIDVSYVLLRDLPALGLLVARSVIDPKRPLDAVTLLEAMDMAQDLLLLAPDDSAWDLYERMEEQARDEHVERAAAQVNEKLAEEVEELRARVADQARKARGVEAQLREQEKAFERAQAALEAKHKEGRTLSPPRQRPEPDPDRSPDPGSEKLELLRKKVADLKALLESSAQERRGLRRELATKTESLSKEAAAAPKVEDDDPDEPETIDEDPQDHRPLRLPDFGERFEPSLAGVPARLAREAVRIVGALAAGDAAAWSGAKRMKSAITVKTVRLSLAWRLLFTVDADAKRLTALEVRHRSELEQALAYYR